MKLDSDQLEWIVREVVGRLRDASYLPLPTGEGRGEGAPTPDAHIILTQTLITTATLEHKLQGVARLSVPARAVVTPSARDLLNQRGVELLRIT